MCFPSVTELCNTDSIHKVFCSFSDSSFPALLLLWLIFLNLVLGGVFMWFVFSGEEKIVEEQARADVLMHLSGHHHITSSVSSLPADGSSRI